MRYRFAPSSPRRVNPLTQALVFAAALTPCAASTAGLSYFDPWYIVTTISGDGRIAAGGWHAHSPTNPNDAAFVAPSGQAITIGRLKPGDENALISAASFDGGVLVGNSYACIGLIRRVCLPAAFRWSNATGMVALPNPLANPSWTFAADVSGDGRYIVGNSTGPFSRIAVLWHPDLHAETLGALHPDSWSSASAVSWDGGVVVGTAGGGADDDPNRREAFRWTRATGMVGLGALPGDQDSSAVDVSMRGDVVVGSSFGTGVSRREQAFRWTPAGGMQGLGFLNGAERSVARAVSGDGRVVVGYSGPSASIDYQGAQAFRWTQETGMQSFASWLTANGVIMPATITLLDAYSTNYDGSVSVGLAREINSPFGTRDIGWIARVGANGAGLLTDIPAFQRGLAETGFAAADAARNLPQNAFDGPYQRSLYDRGGVDANTGNDDRHGCAWAAGRIGFEQDSETRRQSLDAGYCRDFGRWRAGIALASSAAHQRFAFGGRARTDAHRLTLEAALKLDDTWRAELLTGFGEFDGHSLRIYANGARTEASIGHPTGRYQALRARVSAHDLWIWRSASITPYAALSATRSTLESMVETGGTFSSRFEGAEWKDRNAALGVIARIDAGRDTTLTPVLEYAHRLRQTEATMRADPGIPIGVALPVGGGDRDWLRLTLDLDHRLGERGGLRLSLQANTQDETDIGIGAMYALGF